MLVGEAKAFSSILFLNLFLFGIAKHKNAVLDYVHNLRMHNIIYGRLAKNILLKYLFPKMGVHPKYIV